MQTNASMMAPTNWAAQQEDIARRRKMAEMLQAQSLQPISAAQVNGITTQVHPTEYLAKALQAYMGAKQQKDLTEEQKTLGQNYQLAGRDALARGLRSLKGSPERAAMQDPQELEQQADQGTMPPPNIPAVAPDRMGAMDAFGGHPETKPYAAAMMAQMLSPKTSEKLDLGDKWKVTYSDGRVVYEPKSVTPDTKYKEEGDDRRWQGVSGNTNAQIGSAQQLHQTPSGSAVLGANTTLRTHASPSGSAILGAQTARRGQDMSVDPALQGAVSSAREYGKTMGEGNAKAAIDLPQAVATAEQGVNLINQMIGDLTVDERGSLKGGKIPPHPGFQVSVGASAQPGFQYVSGTDKASFYALKDQVLGGAFMEAYKTLKGGGQITEIEGTKATSAITRMNTAQSEPEFVKAAREFQGVINKGVERARARAGGRRASDKSSVFDAADAILRGQ